MRFLPHRKPKPGGPPAVVAGRVSLIVPFRAADAHRSEVWRWLEQYWQFEVPGAEIVVGHAEGDPFCKTCAVNDAVSRSSGDILVLLDADCYIDGPVITRAAERIRDWQRRGIRQWIIPYRRIYRLTEAASAGVLATAPRDPLRFPSPPPGWAVAGTHGSGFGHKFGALIQIWPREAFETVGCMDPRFTGWGGEDIAFVRALDTLYGPHVTTDNDVLHLWHSSIGKDFKDRMWKGQPAPRANDRLASAYSKATGHPAKMRALVDTGCAGVPGHNPHPPHPPHPTHPPHPEPPDPPGRRRRLRLPGRGD